jgi:hypothetical protein
MNRKWIVGVGLVGLSCTALSIQSCSDNSSTGGGDDGGGDTGLDSTASGSSSGTSSSGVTSSSSGTSSSSSGSSSGTSSSSSGGGDSGHDGGDAGDATVSEGGGGDAGDGGDSSNNTGTDAGPDSQADATCPSAWSVAPTVPASITPDSGSGTVVLHALGTGTQNYACLGTPIDGGADAGDAGATFAWTLVTPNATLTDCNGAIIGHHFASDAGATAPEWLEVDNSYIIGHKIAAYTPDGGSGSIPWLLLQATGHDGTDAGVLSNVTYVQRLDTDGGLAPATGCDFDSSGTTTNVGYQADYYFFGP